MKVKIEGLKKEELNPKGFGGMVSRQSVVFRAEKDKEINFDEGLETIATTDAPAMVVDWERWEVVREILPMRFAELPKDDYAPLLDTHSRSSIEKIKGYTFKWSRAENELLCKSFISEAEPGIRQKVKEKSIRNVSIGYETYKEHTVEIPKGTPVTIDGMEYKNEFDDDYPLLVRTKWRVKELSLVPLGADEAAKLREEAKQGIKSEDEELQKKLNDAFEKINSQQEELKNIKSQIKLGTNTMEPKKPEEIKAEERERISQIEAISERFKKNYKGDIQAEARNAINSDMSVDQFRAKVFENFDESKAVETPATALGLSNAEAKRFSITKAINAAAAARRGDANAWKEAKHELEIVNAASEAAMKVEGFKSHGGLIIPAEVLGVARGERTLTTGTPSAGGYLRGTEQQNELIPLLRNKLIATKLGVRMISGLKQNIDIPRQLTAGTFAWGSEGFNPTASDLTLGQVQMSPKEGKSTTSYTRRLLMQSIPSVDAIVNEDLLNIAALGLDDAVFNGAGGNAPTGVLATSGIGTFDGASIDWEKVVAAETDVAVANADVNTLKFAMSPTVRGILKTRAKVQESPIYLMDDRGFVNGYGSEVSNLIGTEDLIFGDWSRVWIADWSLFELFVNPYLDNSGNVSVTVFVYADVAVSIPAALTVADDVS